MAEFEQFVIREKTNAGLAPISIPRRKGQVSGFPGRGPAGRPGEEGRAAKPQPEDGKNRGGFLTQPGFPA